MREFISNRFVSLGSLFLPHSAQKMLYFRHEAFYQMQEAPSHWATFIRPAIGGQQFVDSGRHCFFISMPFFFSVVRTEEADRIADQSRLHQQRSRKHQ